MNKKFTLLAFCLFTCSVSFGGTPVIDGTFDGEGVWGAPVGTGDGLAGWANANARKIYVTSDDTYVYFGAECRADDWMQFIFVVNTKPGGSSTDSWGRLITYNHTNRPDFLLRGDIGKSNYAEYHAWNGTAWTNTGTNINSGGTEVKSSFDAAREGFVEIRVLRTFLENASIYDIQFIIGGDNNTHGCFDAIPNDNNGTSWDPPGNATTVSNYVSNVVLPATLGFFGGEVRQGSALLSWQTLTETNLSHFEVEQSPDARHWNTVGSVPAINQAAGGRYQFTKEKFVSPKAFFRLKVVDKDGSFEHSKMVMLKSGIALGVEIMGNPVRSAIHVAIHNPKAETIHATLVDFNGRRVGQVVYKHPGGSSVLQMQAPAGGAGIYLLQLQGEQTKGVYRIMKQ
jgi:hypothetical protein